MWFVFLINVIIDLKQGIGHIEMLIINLMITKESMINPLSARYVYGGWGIFLITTYFNFIEALTEQSGDDLSVSWDVDHMR